MRHIVIFILSLLFLNLGYSQDHESHEIDSIHFQSKYYIGLSPLAAINTFPTIQINQEVRFNNWLGFNLETGYIFGHNNTERDAKGFRIRGELSFFISNWTNDNNLTNSFKVALFANYRQYNEPYDYKESFDEGYTKTTPLTLTGKLMGYGLLLGHSRGITEHLKLGINYGFGTGKLVITSNKDVPFFRNFGLFSNYQFPDNYNYPITFLNINLSYRITTW